ncbi:MAG: UpxY family transcription antiterminator [Gemmatimonadota bacterium]
MSICPPRQLYMCSAWYACRTRGRSEKKVRQLLQSLGVESYLPLVERTREWSDRSKQVEFPLFPGYVFARFELTRLQDILHTPGLVEVVRVNGYPTPVREEELESVRSLLQGTRDAGVEPVSHEYLARGQEVEVVVGPFQGLSGLLVEMRGTTRVVVRLSAIQLAVSVELNPRSIRPRGIESQALRQR